MHPQTIVMSLGGSLVCPSQVDWKFLQELRALLFAYLSDKEQVRLVIVVGGGAVAREYQQAYQKILQNAPQLAESSDQDWIGIAATFLNAQLVRFALKEHCHDPPCANPHGEVSFRGRILVAYGWEPGCSTDYDMVLWAQKFRSHRVLNFSNITQIYDKDPQKHADARAQKILTWPALQDIVGKVWQPGANVPFDAVATKKAASLGLELIFARGTIENISAALYEKELEGTIVS